VGGVGHLRRGMHETWVGWVTFAAVQLVMFYCGVGGRVQVVPQYPEKERPLPRYKPQSETRRKKSKACLVM
jgi:hypothetical protein